MKQLNYNNKNFRKKFNKHQQAVDAMPKIKEKDKKKIDKVSLYNKNVHKFYKDMGNYIYVCEEKDIMDFMQKNFPYNNYVMKDEVDEDKYKNYTQISLFKTANKHKFLGIGRRYTEQQNIVESTKVSTAQYKTQDEEITLFTPNRAVLDINAGRLIKSRVCDRVLVTRNEAADSDRIRGLNTTIEEEAKKDAELIKSLNLDGDQRKTLIDDLEVVQYEMNLQKYAEEKIKEGSDLLINMTDIIYYINNKDLYNICKNMSDGTVMVGAFHIPKCYINSMQPIVTVANGKMYIEGSMKIRPKFSNTQQKELDYTQCKMQMKVEGNDHYYNHEIRFPQLLDEDVILIPNETENDYVLKLIKTSSIDYGATEYIGFKIIKISNPELDDLLTTVLYNNTQEQLQVEQKWYNTVKINNDVKSKIKMINYIASLTEHKYKILNPMFKESKIEETLNPIEVKTQKEYILYKPNGTFFSAYSTISITGDNFKKPYAKTSIKIETYNKVITKLILADKIDTQVLKSLISYIHKENPETKIDEIIYILVNMIDDVLSAEAKITILSKLTSTEAINGMKKEEYKSLPENAFTALLKGQLLKYMRLKFNSLLGFTDNLNEDKTKNKLQGF